MMRPVLGALLTSGVLAVAFLGCNSILDNTPGTLVVTDEAGVLPEPPPSPAPSEQQPPMETPDAGTTTTPPPDAGEKPSPGCPPGQQMCFGTCVSLTDPLYGCGNPACMPCPSGHSTMACQGRTCVVTACDKGFADCNGMPTDGCETDLSKATSCGACNAACGAVAPMCTPTGPSFQCTNGCTPAAPLNCGAECVDSTTSVNHCGGCNTACPVVLNGTSTCSAGACSFTCKAGFHACTNKCVAATDPAFCGPACTACPVPAGGVATCVNDACGIQCMAPNHACNGKCVAPNDPTACGGACTVCPVPLGGTATCTGGICGTACPAATHLCAGKCVADTDVTACGAMCTACPAPPPNETAACTAGACTATCAAGFADCDKNPATGCEINTMTDPANCGMCGKACVAPTATCVNGVCQ